MKDASFVTDKSNTNDSLDSYNDLTIDDSTLVDDDHTFILATDADMDFKGKAVRELLDLCNGDKMIGAACGRTHPVGKKCSSIVWHQVFEYAKGNYNINSRTCSFALGDISYSRKKNIVQSLCDTEYFR